MFAFITRERDCIARAQRTRYDGKSEPLPPFLLVDVNQLRRFQRLATPKSLPTGFLEDRYKNIHTVIIIIIYCFRRSVYWENNIPAKDYSKTTEFGETMYEHILSHILCYNC